MTDLDDVHDALVAIVTEEGRPIATAPEVAEQLDQTRRKTLDDLRLLERAGDVESHAVGANARVWWPTEHVSISPGASADVNDRTPEPRDGAERAEAPPARETGQASDGVDAASDADSPPEMEANVDEAVRAAVERVAEGWDDTPERLETRKNAAAVVLQHALDTGDAIGKSSDVVDDVRAAFPVEGQKPETYWRKNIRPVLQEHGDYSRGNHGYIVDDLGDREAPTSSGVYDPTKESSTGVADE